MGNKNLTYGQRLDNLQLLSLESARMESDLSTAFKLIDGKMGISVEDVGLSLCHGITRGGGFRLQQECPASVLLQSLFIYRVSLLFNSLRLQLLYLLERISDSGVLKLIVRILIDTYYLFMFQDFRTFFLIVCFNFLENFKFSLWRKMP